MCTRLFKCQTWRLAWCPATVNSASSLRHQTLTHWCPKHDNDRDASVGVYLHTNTNTCANLFHAWHNSRRYWRVSPIRPVWDSRHSPVERRLCGWVSPPPVISTFQSGVSYPLHFSAFFKWLRHYLISREEFSALLSVINPPTRSLIHTYRDIKWERRMLLRVYVFVCVVFSHLFFFMHILGGVSGIDFPVVVPHQGLHNT